MDLKANTEITSHQEIAEVAMDEDRVTAEALGDSLPRHYYRSPQFIMTCIVRYERQVVYQHFD